MSQQINLFNPVFLNQRKYFSTVTMLKMLGLIVLGSALVYGYSWYQVRSLKSQLDEINKHYLSEQTKLQRYTEGPSPKEANQLLEDELKSVELKLNAQRELIQTLKGGVIGNSTGYSEYMRAFARQAVRGLWLKSFNITGDATQMSISGAVLYPELLPVYMQKLNQEKVMRGKPFETLQMHPGGEGGRYVEFTLQSGDVGGAEKK